ncbi:probable siderophore interacting protein [Alloactinosynnema sp. L-07]|uniref:siderophore-interacting protein n=1 Tax=Alloactinosynnema sp. L-07 TaxID=1653480 RepID=UPI00065EF390|nr:siderophore-interacting protein [Alloactinosynnema sp. L-07]CRK61536.1 probable siderophore interacting protein [Alloactinosynnema sp. L-07]
MTDERQILTASVLGSSRVSPTFMRVTIGGPDLEHFAPRGFDQWFRLFMPRQGQDELRLPTRGSALWYAQYLLMAKEIRPLARNYTVRDYRAAGDGRHGDDPEIDIDFACHGDDAPACAWATSATVGTRVGLLDEGPSYHPRAGSRWHLLAGDESALPAVLGILRSLPRDARVEAFIEIPHADDAQLVDAPDGAKIHWLVRHDHQARPGKLALRAVREATLPIGPCYAFVAGESQLATGLRRHLVNDRDVPKADVTFTGYWKVGRAASS